MADTFAWAAERADAHLPEVARALPGFLLVTLHRAENVDDPERLAAWIAALAVDRPVVFPIHPRTRGTLARSHISIPAGVHLIEPVGFLAMVALERAAQAVATDSGGVQKEAYLAGVPCLTLRTETEWVETVEAGWNRVIGSDPRALAASLADPDFMDRTRPRPTLYGDGHAAERIVAALEEAEAAAA
jgi:UDP-N-acetylglucosamine 2-epimerase